MKNLLAVLFCDLFLMAMPNGFGQAASSSSSTTGKPVDTPVTLIQEDTAAGLELWQTTLGRLWIPRPGYYVIAHLQWEQKVERVYNHPMVHVQSGDVVIDCGAHIGGFTRTALDAGARMVIAIEPETANIQAFKRNWAAELKSGKVKLVEKGVWDKDGKLALHISTVGDSHSAVTLQDGKRDEMIELTTLDHLVDSLKLPRVDFIKMDIEGAERNALRGSAGPTTLSAAVGNLQLPFKGGSRGHRSAFMGILPRLSCGF